MSDENKESNQHSCQPVKADYELDDDRYERRRKTDWKYSTLTILTITVCFLAVSTVATMLYDMVVNKREGNADSVGTVFASVVEVIKAIIGM